MARMLATKSWRVVGLVGAEGDRAAGRASSVDHASSGFALGGAGRRRHLGRPPSDRCGSPSARGPRSRAWLPCPCPCGTAARRGRWSRHGSRCDRFSPWKSPLGIAPAGRRWLVGSPSLGRKLFIEAQPRSGCRPPRSGRRQQARDRGREPEPALGTPGDIALQQPVAVLQNTVASQTASSMPSPTNQRNSRL